MFKRKRFLVEIDSDFLFKKVRKYVNVNVFIWNFLTDPPTQKMKHMFHMIILCCTFHKTQKDDDDDDDGNDDDDDGGGGGDMTRESLSLKSIL